MSMRKRETHPPHASHALSGGRVGLRFQQEMPKATAVVFLLLLLRVIRAQLQVQVRRYQSGLNESDLEENFNVEAEYTFPIGFSGDWFTTSHANIPAEGITGVLCHPQDDDYQILNQDHCCSDTDLPKIALIDDGSLCSGQTLSFDALITYSPGNTARDVSYYQDTDIPFAIVSEEFYFTLRDLVQNCSIDEIDTLVHVSVGDVNVTAVQITLITFIVFCGLLWFCILLILLFLTALCCGKCLKKRGSYNVHENQIHELGPEDAHRGIFRGTLTVPYKPEERQFASGDPISQCAICLEDFVEGEMTSILACDASHTFHPTCIDKWLQAQNTCPVCRTMMMNTQL